MQIKLLVSAAAIAMAATIGSASAADRFFIMEGIEAQSMTPLEAAAIFGTFTLAVAPPVAGPANPPPPEPSNDAGNVGDSAFGISNALSAVPTPPAPPVVIFNP